MFAALLVMASPLLNLDVGQGYQILTQIDCETGPGKIDMNGAASTVTVGSGTKRLSLLFVTKWPWSKDSKIGVLSLGTQGKQTILEELSYTSNYVPTPSNGIQAPLLLTEGDATSYMLMPRYDSKKWRWNYEESQVLVHGAVQTYKGVCELKESVE